MFDVLLGMFGCIGGFDNGEIIFGFFDFGVSDGGDGVNDMLFLVFWVSEILDDFFFIFFIGEGFFSGVFMEMLLVWDVIDDIFEGLKFECCFLWGGGFWEGDEVVGECVGG